MPKTKNASKARTLPEPEVVQATRSSNRVSCPDVRFHGSKGNSEDKSPTWVADPHHLNWHWFSPNPRRSHSIQSHPHSDCQTQRVTFLRGLPKLLQELAVISVDVDVYCMITKDYHNDIYIHNIYIYTHTHINTYTHTHTHTHTHTYIHRYIDTQIHRYKDT